MKSQLFWQLALATLIALILAGCGGSSDNVSPGAIIVEVPVGGDGDGGGDSDGGGDGDGDGGGDGDTVASRIPVALESVITDSGEVSSAAFGSRPIYDIDVTVLPSGGLDPEGLLLGNDYIFQITGGGPLRVITGTLDMARGSVLAGASNTEFLIVEQDARINAVGTAEQPVIFTARADIDDTVDSDVDRGLWGGLVLNGRAPINDCPEGAEGGTDACTKEGEANSGTFGGSDPTDSSGTLRYVSVRYAGSNVDPENQLNGIAFQGTGSGTIVEYVQVHNNLDDGIEFFGGTTNARYVVLTGNADDSLDWTDGWKGSIQYLYIEQTGSADNGIEADNREGQENAEPRSLPSIANMSIFGNPAERAIRLRRGTGLHLSNSFVVDSEVCLRVDGVSRDLIGGDLTVAGTSFACTEMNEGDNDGAVESYLDSAEEVSQNGGAVNAVAPGNSFFEVTGFIGAIGPENWTAGWTVTGSVSNTGQPDFGCPTGTTDSGDVINGRRVCELTGTITDDVLLTSNNYYELVGKVVVGLDDSASATLAIQAGTTVFGGTSFDFLVVSRGSQIVAEGTRTAPVIFTSVMDENLRGGADPDTSRGLWGGLVINGYAPINDCPEGAMGGTAGCTKEGEANSGTFGGDQPADNSGVLRYVVVKYAGSNVDPENQLNGIAFQGVGSGTQVEFVQVHNNLDDGIEFFGGNVNARYIVLTGNADDSLDWTDGWQGDVQYLLILQADDSADNGIEADNREGDESSQPRSLPRIANMTIKGNLDERAIRLRRGTGLQLFNSVVTDSNSCLRIQGDSLSLLGDGIGFDGVSFQCASVNEGDDVAAIQALLDSSNVSEDGTAVPPADLSADSFFDNTSFIGAVEDADNDWTAGWTVGMPDSEVDFPCPVGTTELGTLNDKRLCEIAGTVIGDLRLTRNNYYVLGGKVTVGEDNANSAVLSIEAGTTIIGDDAEDFLVISRGSQILANGTNNSPITFTALQDVTGTVGDNVRGLWGGLVINGNAPVNDCPEGAVGGTVECTKEGEANSGIFGGASPDDNSGVLNYLLVKYAGSNVDPENQLNGIAFQGVGAGTQVNYVQVHNNLDDGIEFFGGNVSARYVILTGNADDSLDWTDGWRGSIQFLHIEQGADTADNGIEADNREGDELAMPVSEPSIANMTIVGNVAERAIRLRRGTGLHLWNTVIVGSERCVRVQGESENLYNTGLAFESVSLDCATVAEGDDVEALQTFLDSSANVTQDGSIPVSATLPADGFFEQTDVVGSDVDSWKGNWAFGL
jgi:hypothetical protein